MSGPKRNANAGFRALQVNACNTSLLNCGGLIWRLRLQTDIISVQLYELLILIFNKDEALREHER